MPDFLESAPRAWWSVPLPGIRPTDNDLANYVRSDVVNLPPVPLDVRESLDWLEALDPYAANILDDDDGHRARPFTSAGLDELLRGLAIVPPPTLVQLASRPELAAAIRSCTGCLLDLGDLAVPIAQPTEARLIHLLADSQWCLHWLLYTDQSGREAVVVTDIPLGYELPDDVAEDYEVPSLPLQSGDSRVAVCATSFGEFLYRFWIENELWWVLHMGEPIRDPLAAYARHYNR